MPLLLEEISVGVVAYFDVKKLNRDQRITPPAHPTNRNGPFLCVQLVEGRSTWTALTWKFREERLFIKPEWRDGGTEAWNNRTPYINDGAITYIGENGAFVEASAIADTYMPETRQRVNAAGVEAALIVIARRNGALM